MDSHLTLWAGEAHKQILPGSVAAVFPACTARSRTCAVIAQKLYRLPSQRAAEVPTPLFWQPSPPGAAH